MRVNINLLAVLIASTTPALGQLCATNTLLSTPPTSTATPVQLQSYSYCGGKLIAVAYVYNLNYNKLLNLRYTSSANQTTPPAVIPLNYWEPVALTDWEYWGTLSPVAIDSVHSLVSLTYSATSLNKTFTQPLNLLVQASGVATQNISTIPSIIPLATVSTALSIPTIASATAVTKLPGPPTAAVSPTGFAQDITTFLSTVQGSAAGDAFAYLFKNINPGIDGTIPGTVVAAQSGPDFAQTVPNYEFDWVRDSALTMSVVSTLYSAAKNSVRRSYEDLLLSYATARAIQQSYPTTGLATTGLGEPKFHLNQTVFAGARARPQNDGPASSAITLLSFASEYLANGGNVSTVLQYIWNSATFPATAPVLKDLLYTAAAWSVPSFDLWEEVAGNQFYTRMVQRRALVMGVEMANRLDDIATATTLNTALTSLTPTLAQFWSPTRSAIVYSNSQVLLGKASYLDMSVILGILHGYAGDGVYSYTNDQVLSSALRLVTSFSNLYGINNITTDTAGRPLGIAIGRYPEDVYNGIGSSLGNPWYVTTAAMAQLMYEVSNEYNAAGQISVTNISQPFFSYFAPAAKLRTGQTYVHTSKQYRQAINGINGWGDAFIRTVKMYSPASGQLSEQFNRNTGVPQGAASLSWSYAALLSAAFARAQTMEKTLYVTNLANEGFLPNDVEDAQDDE